MTFWSRVKIWFTRKQRREVVKDVVGPFAIVGFDPADKDGDSTVIAKVDTPLPPNTAVAVVGPGVIAEIEDAGEIFNIVGGDAMWCSRHDRFATHEKGGKQCCDPEKFDVTQCRVAPTLPMISSVRPFKDNSATQELVRRFKAAHKEPGTPKPEAHMRRDLDVKPEPPTIDV